MKIYYFAFILLFAVTGYGQSRYNRKAGDKAFAGMQYANAISHYTAYRLKDTTDVEINRRLATSYFNTQQYEAALPLYAALNRQPTPDSLDMLRYAQLLAMDHQYTAAAVIYTAMQSAGFGNEQFSRTAALYQGGLDQLYQDTANVTIQLLNINSGFADCCAAFYRNGLLFASDRPLTKPSRRINTWNNGGFMRLFYIADSALIAPAGTHDKWYKQRVSFQSKDVVNKDNTAITSNDSKLPAVNQKINFKETPHQLSLQDVFLFDSRLNKKLHAGPATFNGRQDTLYLTTNGKRGADGISRLQLQVFAASHDQWKPLPPFPYNSDTYNTGQAATVPGTATIFFAADMPGGFGGSDIYFSTLTDTGWTTPINAGPMVNTAGNEMFPYISNEHTLFFSSDRWPGLGGLDIFYVPLNKELLPTASPLNIGAPYNSSRNDFGILLTRSGLKGYLSSDRNGNDDLYRFEATKGITQPK